MPSVMSPSRSVGLYSVIFPSGGGWERAVTIHERSRIQVEGREEPDQDEEDVDRHGVGDDLRELLDGLLSGVERRVLPENEAEDDEEARAGGEGRGEEPRSQGRRQPERPGAEAGEKERRHAGGV